MNPMLLAWCPGTDQDCCQPSGPTDIFICVTTEHTGFTSYCVPHDQLGSMPYYYYQDYADIYCQHGVLVGEHGAGPNQMPVQYANGYDQYDIVYTWTSYGQVTSKNNYLYNTVCGQNHQHTWYCGGGFESGIWHDIYTDSRMLTLQIPNFGCLSQVQGPPSPSAPFPSGPGLPPPSPP